MIGTYPKSWRHFTVGMANLNRKSARDAIASFRATAAAGATEQSRNEWLDEQKKLAGWHT